FCNEGVVQFRLEYRIFTKGGDVRWVNELTNVERDAEGRIKNYEGVVIDVTERRLAEEEIRESRAKYQAIVDSFDGLIYSCSQDYRIEFMNRKLIERTGRDATGELCYKVMHERDSACPWCVNDRVFAGETIHWEMFSPRDSRWYYVVNVPIRHADGSMSKHSMMFDITDRKLFEEKLRKQKELLEELNRTLEVRVREEVVKNREKDVMLIQQNRQAALGEILDHIAHQWKQPLNTISLITYLFKENQSLTKAEAGDTADKILGQVEHMSQTLKVFRDFYRPDKEKSIFHIKESIDKAFSFIATALQIEAVKVGIEADPNLAAEGYPKEFAQVILNLLSNARDAFREKGVDKPELVIRVFAEEDAAVVTVTDNGGGIREADLGSIFDLNFTTKRESGGTGIGLYMSRNIIERHMGGTLTAANVAGGARFTIRLKSADPGSVTRG
ncbi:MAG TPA: ATP-binding protein, partial [Geobacteraceae bacterium]